MFGYLMRQANAGALSQMRLLRYQNLILNRTHKNFGHAREKVPGFTLVWHGFLSTIVLLCFIDFNKVKKMINGEREIESTRRY